MRSHETILDNRCRRRKRQHVTLKRILDARKKTPLSIAELSSTSLDLIIGQTSWSPADVEEFGLFVALTLTFNDSDITFNETLFNSVVTTIRTGEALQFFVQFAPSKTHFLKKV